MKRDAEDEARYREFLAWLPKGARLATLEEITAAGSGGVLDTKQLEQHLATRPQARAPESPTQEQARAINRARDDDAARAAEQARIRQKIIDDCTREQAALEDIKTDSEGDLGDGYIPSRGGRGLTLRRGRRLGL